VQAEIHAREDELLGGLTRAQRDAFDAVARQLAARARSDFA
jgi:hypothetical protein